MGGAGTMNRDRNGKASLQLVASTTTAHLQVAADEWDADISDQVADQITAYLNENPAPAGARTVAAWRQYATHLKADAQVRRVAVAAALLIALGPGAC